MVNTSIIPITSASPVDTPSPSSRPNATNTGLDIGRVRAAKVFFNTLYDPDMSYIWMILTVQGTDNSDVHPIMETGSVAPSEKLTMQDKILKSLNFVGGWKSLFPEPSRAPDSELWTTKKKSQGGSEMYWYMFKVPVPFSAFEREGYIETKIRYGRETGGILGLNVSDRNMYWDLYPIERFAVGFKFTIKGDTATRADLLASMRTFGAISQKVHPSESTGSSTSIPVYSTAILIRTWAETKDDIKKEEDFAGNALGREKYKIWSAPKDIPRVDVASVVDYEEEIDVNGQNTLAIADRSKSRQEVVIHANKQVSGKSYPTWIIVGVVGGVLLVALVIFFLWYRARSARSQLVQANIELKEFQRAMAQAPVNYPNGGRVP